MERKARLLLASLGVLGLLAFAPSAQAAFGLEGLVAAPANTDAGAHSDFHTHLEVTSPGDQLRDLTVSLPPGLSGNPQSVPKCPVKNLNADTCPATSQVGTTSVRLTAMSSVPLTVEGSVYNLVPGAGEPARLGIVLRPPDPSHLLLPPIIMQVRVKLRPDFGLDTILTDLPKNAAILNLIPTAIAINSVDLDLKGAFMSNPSSCGTQTTRFSARSWAMAESDSPATGSATFESTKCSSQPYDPKASLRVDGNGDPLSSGSRPTVTSVITQSAGQANNKRAAVLLPNTIGVDGARFENACLAADFQAGTCADDTQVGNAKAVSPLLDSELSGPVYVVATDALPKIGVDLRGTLPLKILGSTGLKHGRVETVFDGLPDLPLSKFELKFPGGPTGLLRVVGNVCASTSTFDADFTSQAGQTLSRTLPTTPVGTCPGGGNGQGNQVRKPSARIKVSGAKRHRPRVTIRVRSGGAPMRSVKIRLPGALKLGRDAAAHLIVKANDRRIRGKKRLIVKGRILRLRRLPGKGAAALMVRIRPGAIARPRAAKKGRKLIFRVRILRVGQKMVSLKVPVRAKR